MGPLNTNVLATSVEMVKRLLDKSTPAVAKLNVCIADVRDVALAHLRAMTVPEAAGKRMLLKSTLRMQGIKLLICLKSGHLICTSNTWMKDIALILQKEFKPQGYFIPTMVAPNFFVWLNSWIERTYRLVVPRLSRDYRFENTRVC